MYQLTSRPVICQFTDVILLAKGVDLALKLAKGFGRVAMGTNVADFILGIICAAFRQLLNAYA